MALIGVGHLVGLSGWHCNGNRDAGHLAGLVPILTAMHGASGDIATLVDDTFRNDVRFIGAGTMA